MTAITEKIEDDEYSLKTRISGGELLRDEGEDSLVRAWASGSVVDEGGNVWLREDFLPAVLRIRAFAELSRFKPDKKDVTVFDGATWFRGARVAELLDFVREKNDDARTHAEESRNLYLKIRNSDAAVFRQRAFLDLNPDLKNRLKQRRIRTRRLLRDELTGKWLRRRSAEFVHIRNPCFYGELEDQVWNGLVVNRLTRLKILEANVADEVELLRLCRREGWDRKKWSSRFLENLPTTYRRVMELESHRSE